MILQITQTGYIFIYIGIGLLALYLLGMVFTVVMVWWFRRALKIHRNGMGIASFTKYDNLKKLYNVMVKNGVEIDASISEMFENIDTNQFKNPDMKEGYESIEKLTYLRESLMSLARKQKQLEKNEIFNNAKAAILEMDGFYRNAIALYNADILGYNYWIRFLPYRYLFLIFKIKTKDLI